MVKKFGERIMMEGVKIISVHMVRMYIWHDINSTNSVNLPFKKVNNAIYTSICMYVCVFACMYVQVPTKNWLDEHT